MLRCSSPLQLILVGTCNTDIVTAFLNAYVKAEIYIQLPEGHEQPGMCGRLGRAIYGLKQSGREWFGHQLEKCGNGEIP